MSIENVKNFHCYVLKHTFTQCDAIPLQATKLAVKIPDLFNFQLLTVDDTAAALKVHAETVRRMIRRQELHAVKVAGKWRVPQSALEAMQRPSAQSQADVSSEVTP